MPWRNNYIKFMGYLYPTYGAVQQFAPTAREGWKMHIAGVGTDRDQVMAAVEKVLLSSNCFFKVDPDTPVKNNKLVTIYAPTKYDLKKLVGILGSNLRATGLGPCQILNELSVGYRLYVRYGGLKDHFIYNQARTGKIRDNRQQVKPNWIPEWSSIQDNNIPWPQ